VIDGIAWDSNYFLVWDNVDPLSKLSVTYRDPAPNILSAVIIDPGDQIEIKFSVPVAMSDPGLEIWTERNCESFITADLWVDNVENCKAVFQTTTILVLTVNVVASGNVVPGTAIKFNDNVLVQADSLLSDDIKASIQLTRSMELSPVTLTISPPYSLNSCADLVIDLSSIGNLAGKPISTISITYTANSLDTSDTSLQAYIGFAMQDFLKVIN
jgi:hypothetical protein